MGRSATSLWLGAAELVRLDDVPSRRRDGQNSGRLLVSSAFTAHPIERSDGVVDGCAAIPRPQGSTARH